MEINHGASLLAMLDNMIEAKSKEAHAGKELADAWLELRELQRQRAYYELKYNDPTLQ